MAAAEHSAPHYTHKNPTIELLVIAAPLILMMFSRMAMSLIDFFMVSWLGTEAQAAIGPAGIAAFTLSVIGMGIAGAVQTYVSQSEGRGEPEECGGYAWQSLYLAGLMGIIAFPVGWTAPTWFGFIAAIGNHSPEVAAIEIEYLSIAVHIVAPATICAGIQSFFNGIQKPMIGLYMMLISTIVNALANCALMFGMWGFPELGVAGAAWGTVIGWAVRAILLMGAMFLPQFERHYGVIRGLGYSWQKTKALLYVGAPGSIQWLVEFGSWALFNLLVMPRFGDVIMAGANIGIQIMHIAFMPAIGLGHALTSQVGFAIGEGRNDKAFERAKIAGWVMGSFMVPCGLLMFFFRAELIGLFSTDSAVIAAGSVVLIWVAIFQLGDALAITYMSALRGAGDTRVPAIWMIGLSWAFQGIGAFAIAYYRPDLGVGGPWAMCTVFITAIGLYATWRWYCGPWQKIRLFNEDPTESDTSRTDSNESGGIANST